MSTTTFDWGDSPDPYIMLDRGSITGGDHSPVTTPSSEGLRIELGPGFSQLLSKLLPRAGGLAVRALHFGQEVAHSARGVLQSSNRN